MIVKFILELSKSLKADPRKYIRPFFTRMKMADDELRKYIQKRTKQKNRRSCPFEVTHLLPKDLQKCFQSRVVSQLSSALSKMSCQETSYYFHLRVKSGL
ncbi:unnamed protein product [Rotaria sp. Silwood2]|nr:unnamed protein product [Rotaria sp. Silwood2]